MGCFAVHWVYRPYVYRSFVDELVPYAGVWRLQADMRKQQYAPLLMAPMIARQRALGQQQQAGDMGRGRGRTGVRGGGPRGGGRPGGMLDHEGMPPYHHGPYPHPQHSNAGMGSAAGIGAGAGIMGAAGGPVHSSMGLGPGRPAHGAGGPGGLPSFQSSAGVGGVGMGGGGLGPRLLEQQQQQQQQLVHAAGGGGAGGGQGWSDEDFVECYRQHGRHWEAYCRVLGVRTESAAKQYYYRNKDRLGLDRVQVAWQAAGGSVEEAEGEAGGPGAAHASQAPPPVRRAYLPAKGSMEDVSAALGPLGGRGGGFAHERQATSSEPPEDASPRGAGEEGQGAVEHKDGVLVGALDAEHPVQQLLQMPAKGPGRGRRSARAPIGNAAVVGSVLLHAASLETTETLRQEGEPPVVLGHRTVVKTESGLVAGEHEGDPRSDSEFDAAAAAAAVTGAAPAAVKAAGAGGGGGAAGAASHVEHATGHRELSTLIDLSAALASSGAGSALSHLLSSAGLQLHAPTEGGPEGAAGPGGAKGTKGGELQGVVAGSPEGHLTGLQLAGLVGTHGQQQVQGGRGELDRDWERVQQGGAGRGNGALAGLNLGSVLGGLLHGAGGGGCAGGGGGGGTGATISLFTGELVRANGRWAQGPAASTSSLSVVLIGCR